MTSLPFFKHRLYAFRNNEASHEGLIFAHGCVMSRWIIFGVVMFGKFGGN